MCGDDGSLFCVVKIFCDDFVYFVELFVLIEFV